MHDYSPAELQAKSHLFMGGVICKAPSSGQFLVIVDLVPAENEDAQKLVDLCRAGHPVSVHFRGKGAAEPVLVSDVTSYGEAIIRCKTQEDAQRVVDQLQA